MYARMNITFQLLLFTQSQDIMSLSINHKAQYLYTLLNRVPCSGIKGVCGQCVSLYLSLVMIEYIMRMEKGISQGSKWEQGGG